MIRKHLNRCKGRYSRSSLGREEWRGGEARGGECGSELGISKSKTVQTIKSGFTVSAVPMPGLAPEQQASASAHKLDCLLIRGREGSCSD